jgi:hypothetical protein
MSKTQNLSAFGSAGVDEKFTRVHELFLADQRDKEPWGGSVACWYPCP